MKIRALYVSFILAAAVGALGYFVPLAQAKPSDVIPGQYIVVFKDDVDSNSLSNMLAGRLNFGLSHVYNNVLKGFSAQLPPVALAMLRNDPRVAFISEDHTVSIDAKGQASIQSVQTIPTGIRRVGATSNINKGAGVGVAIIDTGIDLSHPDLKANIATQQKSCIFSAFSAKDDNGHGTHVAGTIAALDNSQGVVGVAPQAKLYAVKVLDRNGSGSWSSVICGIDWVTAHAAAYGIKVANMSLGGSGTSDNNCGNTNNDALHNAICRSTAAGVTYVVAAGNSAGNSSNFVPAAYDDTVITVSALADSNGAAGGTGGATSYGADDTFATFSNFGSVVDIGAPGVNIFSTWKGGAYATLSGTSMATPHVTGAAALYIASHPGALWTSVRDALVSAGEDLNAGHTDTTGLHPEPVLQASSL